MSADLAAAVADWAAARADVHAVVLVGSRARARPPADAWSDHDFVLVVNHPAPFLRSGDWLTEIAPWLLSFVEPAAQSELLERRVLFEDGADADFSILPLERVAAVAEQARAVLGRGVRVLVDKGGVAGPFAVADAGVPNPPLAGHAERVNDFWYRAILSARKLRRGELYVAVQGVNCGLRSLLVAAIALEATTACAIGSTSRARRRACRSRTARSFTTSVTRTAPT